MYFVQKSNFNIISRVCSPPHIYFACVWHESKYYHCNILQGWKNLPIKKIYHVLSKFATKWNSIVPLCTALFQSSVSVYKIQEIFVNYWSHFHRFLSLELRSIQSDALASDWELKYPIRYLSIRSDAKSYKRKLKFQNQILKYLIRY